MLQTDSSEYDILTDAVTAVKYLDQNALSCEIGLRQGGGSHLMIKALYDSDQLSRTHIAIDPYGNIEYRSTETETVRYDYTNRMRNECMHDLYKVIIEEFNNLINVLVFNLEDSEFFKRFEDGIPIYDEYKRYATQYAVIHFDGPHAFEPLQNEVLFFIPRTLVGGMFVFDDISNYDHDRLETFLLAQNFSLVRKGSRKASYIKNA